MWLAALLFVAVGLGDLLRPRDDVRRPWRAVISAASGTALAAVLIALASTPWGWLALVAVVTLAWNLGSTLLPSRLQLLPVVLLAVVVLLALAFPHVFPAPAGALGAWFGELPYSALAGTSLDRAALLVGYSVFLVQSANRVVVAVLDLTDARLQRGSLQLKGGRIIGPLERLFILWMAVAGQALAVTAIIAAKSILRFPEIRDSGKGSARGVLAEYVLVGSLVSWGLALLVVPIH
jgi:hypothetical protein